MRSVLLRHCPQPVQGQSGPNPFRRFSQAAQCSNKAHATTDHPRTPPASRVSVCRAPPFPAWRHKVKSCGTPQAPAMALKAFPRILAGLRYWPSSPEDTSCPNVRATITARIAVLVMLANLPGNEPVAFHARRDGAFTSPAIFRQPFPNGSPVKTEPPDSRVSTCQLDTSRVGA